MNRGAGPVERAGAGLADGGGWEDDVAHVRELEHLAPVREGVRADDLQRPGAAIRRRPRKLPKRAAAGTRQVVGGLR